VLALALDSIRELARIIVGLWEFEIVRISLNVHVLSGYSPMLGVQAGKVELAFIWVGLFNFKNSLFFSNIQYKLKSKN